MLSHFYDLTENLIEDIFAETTNGNGAMNRMSAGCQYKHPFQFYSDVPKIASARIVRKILWKHYWMLVKIIHLLIVGVAN